MTKTFKLARNGKECFALIRQIPGLDTLYAVGDKIKYGSGPRWTVVEVRG